MPYIAVEPFKFNGKRYSPGDEAPGDETLVGAGLVVDAEASQIVEIETDIDSQDETDGTDETGGPDGSQDDDEADDDETDKGDDAPRFKAEHRGSGRWYIIDSQNGESVSEALTKVHAIQLADEMNAAEAPAGE